MCALHFLDDEHLPGQLYHTLLINS